MNLRRTICNVAALACLGLLAGRESSTAEPSAPASQPPANTIEDPYPPAARALNLPGHVTLNCVAASDGTVRNCKVASEDPTDWGFGEGALKAASTLNIGPGAPDRPVQVPIDFHLEAGAVSNPLITISGFYIPVDQVQWVRQPDASDFAATYPANAVQSRTDVRVVFACRVAADGALTACVMLSEEPKGEKMLRAVSYMASRFQMRPHLKDGRPVENGVFKMTLRWSLSN